MRKETIYWVDVYEFLPSNAREVLVYCVLKGMKSAGFVHRAKYHDSEWWVFADEKFSEAYPEYAVKAWCPGVFGVRKDGKKTYGFTKDEILCIAELNRKQKALLDAIFREEKEE